MKNELRVFAGNLIRAARSYYRSRRRAKNLTVLGAPDQCTWRLADWSRKNLIRSKSYD